MTEDKKLAEFLFSKARPEEKKASLNAALAYASHSMSPDLVKVLLNEGAHPAPCIQSDDFLPLTIAVKAGQVETVKLLLEAGADPRQSASWAHGTALSWSKNHPEIQHMFANYLKDKNPDAVFRPSYWGDWEEEIFPNRKA